MNISALSSFDFLPYFTTEAVKQLLGDDSAAAGSIQTALYRWMKKGHLIQLKKGVYMTRHFFDQHHSDVDFLPAVSAILIPQSYNSMESVLQQYGILTEITYPISSITIKQPRVIENTLGTFSYRHIKKEFYQGFSITDYVGIPFSRASLSKALFDYFYFHSLTRKDWVENDHLAEDLRLNLEEFSDKDRSDFADYVEMSKNLRLLRIFKNLRKTIWLH
jgi:hypothetical protein